jgi:4-cresol dehydrogenase (hydroxylating)
VSQPPGLGAALAHWRRALGDSHVLTSGPDLDAANAATFAAPQRVPAIIRPGDREAVQACMRVANTHGVPVYPVSGGRNWGLGSALPVTDGCVLLDLRRMDRVVEVNEEQGFITVQPGVTFQRAHAVLRERGSRLVLGTVGGPPDSSLVGNAVERGDTETGDVFSQVCALEVVLPTGGCVRTGYARGGAHRVAPLFRWGVGPHVDGLFTQSNLGVVTEMTLWLPGLPEAYQPFLGVVGDVRRLPGLVDGARRLLDEGTVRPPLFLWDAGKALSVLGTYPFAAVGGVTPLSAETVVRMARRAGLGAWMVTGALQAGDTRVLDALRGRVTETLDPLLGTLQFERPVGPGPGHPLLQPPGERNLAMMYWRKRTPAPPVADPHRDGCGFIWCTAAVPFRGDDVVQAAALAGATVAEHGLEPNLAFIAPQSRGLYLLAALAYDRAVAGEDARAMACHDAIQDAWAAAGYPPFRLGVQSMAWLPAMTGDDRAFLRALKDAVDPGRILAPGRYEPRDLLPADPAPGPLDASPPAR